MKIKIYGNTLDTETLLDRVDTAIQELGLDELIKTQIVNDEDLKIELNISEEPALIIEEESINFRDIIFEGIVPEIDDLKSMFVSIIGGGEQYEGCEGTGCGGSCNGCGK